MFREVGVLCKKPRLPKASKLGKIHANDPKNINRIKTFCAIFCVIRGNEKPKEPLWFRSKIERRHPDSFVDRRLLQHAQRNVISRLLKGFGGYCSEIVFPLPEKISLLPLLLRRNLSLPLGKRNLFDALKV